MDWSGGCCCCWSAECLRIEQSSGSSEGYYICVALMHLGWRRLGVLQQRRWSFQGRFYTALTFLSLWSQSSRISTVFLECRCYCRRRTVAVYRFERHALLNLLRYRRRMKVLDLRSLRCHLGVLLFCCSVHCS